MHRILIADDDRDTCRYIQRHLMMEPQLGIDTDNVDIVHDRDAALDLLRRHSYAVLILDLWMPDREGNVDREAGMRIFERSRECTPAPEVILITGHSSLDTALRATGLGALDYMMRPLDYQHLMELLRQGLEKHASLLKDEDRPPHLDEEVFIGGSKPMMELMKEVGRIANTHADVLLFGESGTGKDMLARAIHRNSPRRNGPFVPVNCSAIPSELIEAELFGIEKRVATDVDPRAGKFREADGGVLFLDEIGELNLDIQPKLLRALDTKEIQRVGGTTQRVDVRIVAATNRDLRVAVGEHDFRSDLYFRLSGVTIRVPPLRARKEDIPLLAEHFVEEYKQELKKPYIEGVDAAALDKLQQYDWPGNVRELERAIKYAVTTCNRRQLTMDTFPAELVDSLRAAQREAPDGSDLAGLLEVEQLEEAISQFERLYLQHHLEKNDWNISQTAKQLRISRQGLHRKIKSYRLER